MVLASTVLAWEAVLSGICLLVPTLWLVVRLNWLFRTNDNFRYQMCLIAAIALFLIAYAGVLFVASQEIREVAEQVIVGSC